MKTQKLQIKNPEGLHLRVAADLVMIAKKYNCKVEISCENCPKADACSILQLLLLNASQGKTLNIETEGPDEELVLEEIKNFFEYGAGI